MEECWPNKEQHIEIGSQCQTCLSLLILLQRSTYVAWMAGKKIGHLGSQVALLQHGFADESVPGLYDVSQPAFA